MPLFLATAINEFSGLLLFFALLLMLFAVAIFLVNSYQIFSQGEEQAAVEEGESASGSQGLGLTDGQRQQPAAANAGPSQSTSNERRPLSYYYQNGPELSNSQESNNQRLWPLFGAALLVAGSALAAAVYWRQRQSR